MSYINNLTDRKLISPPKWLPSNVHYEVMMGSVAYGVSDDTSDVDLYGFAIPPKEEVFPHLKGEILGFGRQIQRFEQFQQHHIHDKDALAGKGRDYDITIYSIVKYFQLCMENNPNMMDSLFVPQNCVLHCSQIGNMVRENRRLFLHKGCWHKLKGYAYSQIHKMKIKNPEETSKRKELVERFGYDVKFGYHTVRLMLEAEQVLVEQDLDLQRHREQLKAIRRGEWTEQAIYDFFTEKEKTLEEVYHKSTLRYKPDESAIKQLLLDCLEHHYGSLKDCVVILDKYELMVKQIKEIVNG